MTTGFALALVVYFASFSWIQHQRDKKGAWQIVFSSDDSATPSISISEPGLNISYQKIVFADRKIEQTNFSERVVVNQPIAKAPFGEIIFQDATFLPGTITFNFFGHEVELMPRAMVIDKEDRAWNSTANIVLTGEGKSTPMPVKKKSPFR